MATTSRLLKIICLFCKSALSKRRYSAKETYNFQEPTNRSHPIVVGQLLMRRLMCRFSMHELYRITDAQHSRWAPSHSLIHVKGVADGVVVGGSEVRFQTQSRTHRRDVKKNHATATGKWNDPLLQTYVYTYIPITYGYLSGVLQHRVVFCGKNMPGRPNRKNDIVW